MPMEYIVMILCITATTRMDDEVELEERPMLLVQIEEDHFVAGFYQCIEKDRQKVWHDRHIKNKQFQQGDLVLLYDNKFLTHPGKLQMHWLGPLLINSIAS